VTYVLPFLYLFYSLRYGDAAGDNPWGATGLEWTVPSPPPPHNFTVTPVVSRPAYDYDVDSNESEPAR